MNRIYCAVVCIVLIAGGAAAQAVSVHTNGWIVAANPVAGTITVSHDRVGTIIENARLSAEGQPLSHWSAEALPNLLAIKTTHPRGAWQIAADAAGLRISSTSAVASLTGIIPDRERTVARALDRWGVPVDWVGTSEVRESYGGTETHNQSFLPRRNPEVMYFALGPAAGSVFHDVFDRRTDSMIRLGETALLQHGPGDTSLRLSLGVPGNVLVSLEPDYYTKVLGVPFYVPFDDSEFKTAPMVWSSWTSYYAEVTEQDMVRNTDWIAANLKAYGFEYVELDDGYDRGKNGEHYWIENWDRKTFPHGPKWLAEYIKSKGLHAGIWLVPNAYAGAVEQHPDWYLRDKQGKLILDYHTPALDSSNPQVLDFLKKLFSTLNGWGYDYYKFDGEHALPKYAPPVDHDKLFDKTTDPIAIYRNRLKVIRETIGPRTFIEGCNAGTPLNGIGFFNSDFNGADLYASWQGMYALFSSINGNAFLNRMLVYLMPGEGLELGHPMTVEQAMKQRDASVVRTARSREAPLAGFGVTDAEARTLVSYIALTGVAYPLASVMPELPEDRVRLLKMTLPTTPIYPLDLYSRGTDIKWDTFKHTTADTYIHNYPEILDLKVNAGSGLYDVVAVTNWRSEPVKREVPFAGKLGLSPDERYVVFDFWNQKLLGEFSGSVSLDVAPHDTRVLLVHPLAGRPQFVGTSRHITGAYSVSAVTWNAGKKALSGVSHVVAGDPYSVWVHLPDGASVSQVRATAAGRSVTAHQTSSGRLLTVTIPPQPAAGPVDWQIEFTGNLK